MNPPSSHYLPCLVVTRDCPDIDCMSLPRARAHIQCPNSIAQSIAMDFEMESAVQSYLSPSAALLTFVPLPFASRPP
eukprot:1253059-Pyramimonas_sp.AAC.1